jgi:hypothetical protein
MTSRNTRQAGAATRPARASVALGGTLAASLALSVPKPPAPDIPGAPPRTRARGSAKALRADQKRLADLKVKLGDPDYMNGAILRIATVLSARLTLR